jgi:hypothetical protein
MSYFANNVTFVISYPIPPLVDVVLASSRFVCLDAVRAMPSDRFRPDRSFAPSSGLALVDRDVVFRYIRPITKDRLRHARRCRRRLGAWGESRLVGRERFAFVEDHPTVRFEIREPWKPLCPLHPLGHSSHLIGVSPRQPQSARTVRTVEPCQSLLLGIFGVRKSDDVVEVGVSRRIGEVSVGGEDATTSALGGCGTTGWRPG